MAEKSVEIVTSWGPGGYELYGKRFLESFVKHFPVNTRLWAFYHDSELPDDAPEDARIAYLNLNEDVTYTEFKRKYGHFNGGQPYNFRFDVAKFCNKVFALDIVSDKMRDLDYCPILIWLDADTFATKDIPEGWLEQQLGYADLAWLDRTAIDYAETSFLAFRLNARSNSVIDDIAIMYESGDFQRLREWHDGFVITHIIKMHEWHGYQTKNLSIDCKDLAAFASSPLAEFMTHLKGNLKNAPVSAAPTGPQPFRVNPVDVVSKPELIENVKANSKAIEARLQRYLPHSRRCWIVGGGPSLYRFEGMLRGANDRGEVIACVKHALPVLRSWGVEPDYCVVLDPRSVSGVSTHSQVRKDLYEGEWPNTEFLVASMTNQDTVQLLKERGFKLRLWHAFTQTLAEANVADTFMVSGGTCAAMRAFGIMYAMGFRRFDVVGVDAGQADEPSAEELTKLVNGNPKWFRVGTNPDPNVGRKWWTTGELVALGQDVDDLARKDGIEASINWLGESLASELWHGFKRETLKEWNYGA